MVAFKETGALCLINEVLKKELGAVVAIEENHASVVPTIISMAFDSPIVKDL
ncbi:hypothetical protein [Peribacillus frigoritolerans]|uniref:hypothetical protein n=1 Tax=Peribacillus frigoritolerans TaxID=450367 RepID=UPI003F80EA49